MSYSRFFLCDLQVHSVADPAHSYGDWGSRDPDSRFADSLVSAHRQRGIEVLAITDHNRVDWYPALADAGERNGVYVFPGLEVSVNGCHILVIWDRTDEGYDLARRFVASLWTPGEPAFERNGDPRPVTRGGVKEIATEAIEHKALVIAPHSTARGMGLFARGVVRNSREVAQSGLISAFDVCGNSAADVLSNPRSEFGEIQPTWLITGDTRSFEGVGERACYLKLNDPPTLEGIRQALLSPQTRIVLPSTLEHDWGLVRGLRFAQSVDPNWPRITKIHIEGGFHDGLSVSLGPRLNAVIGGKGTGKSTLIEIVRFVLDAGHSTTQEAMGNRRHNFRANSQAAIGFIGADAEVYEVRRSGDESPPILYRSGRQTDVETRRRVQVRVFGQRELHELAGSQELLRDFLASQAAPGWSDERNLQAQVMGDLQGFDSELGGLETEIARLAEDEAEVHDLRDRLAAAEERGVAQILARSQRLVELEGDLNRFMQWPERIQRSATQIEGELPPPNPPEHESAPSDLSPLLTTLAQEVLERGHRLSDAIERTQEALHEPESLWRTWMSEERTRLQRELAEAGIENAEDLESLQRRADDLAREIEALPGKRGRQTELEDRRREALLNLWESRRRLSRLIEQSARNLTQRVGAKVRVTVVPLADRTQMMAVLEEAVRGQQVRRDQLQRLAALSPQALAEAIRGGAEILVENGVTGGTAAKLAALPPGAIRQIESTDTPDEVFVEIDLGPPGAENWNRVKDVSPGQRATAMLALALASGNEPLIIDQPEDDLDNRYIYEEVVQVLANVCTSRQVIVATHNANIPILGDAELILALDADADRGRVLACGGLEDRDVVENARTILEGGDEAFEARHRRYRRTGW